MLSVVSFFAVFFNVIAIEVLVGVGVYRLFFRYGCGGR